jgi:hypothetical protein
MAIGSVLQGWRQASFGKCEAKEAAFAAATSHARSQPGSRARSVDLLTPKLFSEGFSYVDDRPTND